MEEGLSECAHVHAQFGINCTAGMVPPIKLLLNFLGTRTLACSE